MSAGAIPVLLYHSVSDRPPSAGAWGAVSPVEFARHVEVIAGRGCHALTVSELAEALRGRLPVPERPVLITFDDGYEDTPAAVDRLGNHGLCATVYVSTEALDSRGRLSRRQLVALAAGGAAELGSHGVRHLHLDELPASAVPRELTVSKAVLEGLIEQRVDSFAYPHGAYDRTVRAAVMAAGYRSAAAVKNAISHLDDDPFAIARFTVMAGTSTERIHEVLSGRHVPRAWTRERTRTRAARILRRQRSRRRLWAEAVR